MDVPQRTRSCIRKPRSQGQGTPRGSQQICIPMTPEFYDRIWNDAREVRCYLEPLIQTMPELFPDGIQDGYQLSGRLPESKKMPGIRLRQLRLPNRVYTLRPSFVMSYMTGEVEELEHPLLLLSFGVPCWVVTKIFGRNDMFWQRHRTVGTQQLGGNHGSRPGAAPRASGGRRTSCRLVR